MELLPTAEACERSPPKVYVLLLHLLFATINRLQQWTLSSLTTSHNNQLLKSIQPLKFNQNFPLYPYFLNWRSSAQFSAPTTTPSLVEHHNTVIQLQSRFGSNCTIIVKDIKGRRIITALFFMPYCQGQHPGDPMARLPQGCHMAVLGNEPSAWTTPAPALFKGYLIPRQRWQLSTSFFLPTYL